MPEPLLYVTKDEVPHATVKALQERQGNASIYGLRPDSVISEKIEEALKEYGKVTRISGDRLLLRNSKTKAINLVGG